MAINKRELPPSLTEIAARSEAYLLRFARIRPIKQFVAREQYLAFVEDVDTGAELNILRDDYNLNLEVTLGATRRGKDLHHLLLQLPHNEYMQPTFARVVETYRGVQPIRYLEPAEYQRAGREILRVFDLFEQIESMQ